MKYYFCLVLSVSALYGMDVPLEDPMGTPPGSPQFYSAPNSPETRRYNRQQLLALGNAVQCPLSHSMDAAIKSVKIKTAVTAKKTFQGKHKHYAKK
jgi:hypothetical protein